VDTAKTMDGRQRLRRKYSVIQHW